MEPEVRYCTAKDGVRIAYTVTGEGPPLLMAVDPMSSHVQLEWEHPTSGAVQREYARRNTLIRYDPRGSGLSDRVIPQSVEEYLLDIDAVVERAGFDRFAMNSVLTSTLPMIMYAALNSERVTRFLIVDGFLKMRDLLGTPQAQALLAAAKTDWFLATETIGYIAFGAGADVNSGHGAYIRACVGPENLEITDRTMQIDVTEYARKVKAPTLVMKHEGLAVVTMDATKELVSIIPNAQLVVLDGTFVDDIERTAARAMSFINDTVLQPATASPAPTLPSGTAVILFADIVDSTALTERLGDDAFREKARSLDAAMRGAIRANGGTAVEGMTLGDGVLAVFTSARQAIACAQACHASANDAGLELHAGIHAGDVIREANNVYGGAVNIAARVAAASAAGETLVSGTVRDLARTSAGVSFEDRGEQELKGIEEPVRLFAVQWSD